MRHLRLGFAAAIALVAGATMAQADEQYPSRPIKFITSVPPGGSVDTLSRLVAEKLRQKWGQPVVVENRPGASNNIGMEAVVRAAPDGYTLLFSPGQPLIVNKLLFPKLAYDPDALVPVSRLATNPIVLAVHPQVPAKTLKDFIAYAEANPGRLNYATGGNGGTPHLGAELFQTMAGVTMTKVPFKGVAPAMLGLISGQVDLIFVDISTAIEPYRNHDLRILGVAADKRHQALPDVPALTELFPGFTSETWFCLAAPPKTPDAIVHKVSAAAAEAVHQPDVMKRLLDMGNIEAIGSTPEEMAAFMQKEADRWGGVIRATGATGDD
jgi:tripartite-type tricarboxylate transporter receptor subunit TctC